MSSTDLWSSLALTAGVVIAVLQIVDWLLTKSQKDRLRDRLAAAWIWLDDHKRLSIGKSLRRSDVRGIIRWVVLLLVLFVTFELALAVLVGVTIVPWTFIYIHVGSPRIFPEQVLVDIGALALGVVGFTLAVAPRLSGYVEQARTIWGVFARSVVILVVLSVVAYGVLTAVSELYAETIDAADEAAKAQSAHLWPENPTGIMDFAAYSEQLKRYRESYVPAYRMHLESELAPRWALVLSHAVTAALAGVVIASMLVWSGILFLTVGWALAVACASLAARSLAFAIYRIEESPKGPVLGLSGLLVGVGALAKILTA